MFYLCYGGSSRRLLMMLGKIRRRNVCTFLHPLLEGTSQGRRLVHAEEYV
jgi:hypothetical protein